MLLTNATVPVKYKEPSSVHIGNSKGFKPLISSSESQFQSELKASQWFEEIWSELEEKTVFLKRFLVLSQVIWSDLKVFTVTYLQQNKRFKAFDNYLTVIFCDLQVSVI